LEAYVVETPVGLFILDEKGDVLERLFFSNEPQAAASEFKQVQEGKATKPITEAMKRVAKKSGPLVFDNQQLANTCAKEGDLDVTVRASAIAEKFRSELASEWDGRQAWLKKQSLESPATQTPQAYNEFVRQVTLQLARAGIAVAAAKRDLSAVQAVRAMDDLDKVLNLLAGRVREWFGLHFPEMDRIVEKHDTYARLVSKLGNRRNFTNEKVLAEGIPKENADVLATAARKSMGAEISDADLRVLQSFCELMLDLYKFRAKSESYVEDVMKQVAPNMTAIVGAALSARLISIAGSLDNLAKMPASTLQVLGAEKALFRSLKTGARPPKHGVIFQHTAIHQAPRWQRGKIARALSGKLSIAARIDDFGGEFLGEKLRNDVNRKVDEIKERYKTPPPAKKRDVGRRR
jgi:nucleolar protein 56